MRYCVYFLGVSSNQITGPSRQAKNTQNNNRRWKTVACMSLTAQGNLIKDL